MEIKKYYHVISCFFDNGYISANLTECEGEMPATSHREMKKCDMYHDYFESEKEARTFLNTVQDA